MTLVYLSFTLGLIQVGKTYIILDCKGCMEWVKPGLLSDCTAINGELVNAPISTPMLTTYPGYTEFF